MKKKIITKSIQEQCKHIVELPIRRLMMAKQTSQIVEVSPTMNLQNVAYDLISSPSKLEMKFLEIYLPLPSILAQKSLLQVRIGNNSAWS